MSAAHRWNEPSELLARIREIALDEAASWPPAWQVLLDPPEAELVESERRRRGRPRDPARTRVVTLATRERIAPPARVLAIASLVAGAPLPAAWRSLTARAVIRAEARCAGHLARIDRQQFESNSCLSRDFDEASHGKSCRKPQVN